MLICSDHLNDINICFSDRNDCGNKDKSLPGPEVQGITDFHIKRCSTRYLFQVHRGESQDYARFVTRFNARKNS